jgi:2'-5' RNA ligase
LSLTGTFAPDERIRLFLGLRLPEDIVDGVVAWQGRELAAARDVRIVPPQNLHVTLAFLGHRPASDLEGIAGSLRAASGAVLAPLRFSTRRYRETRSVGMLVFDDAGGRAGAFAGDLHARLEELGVYERERRPWLPHATVVRFRQPPRLQPELPGLPAFSPSDAAVYHSVLRRGGAQYEVLESVPLGG